MAVASTVGEPPPYAVQSVDNALQLLMILRRDGVLRISEAAAELGVARSTAHRLISMLRFRGFVERTCDRTYTPGAALAHLATARDDLTSLAGIARPHLIALARRVNESTLLSVLDGTEVRFLDTVEAKRPLHVGSRVGVRLSARRTAVGKVLLADLPLERIFELWPELTHDDEARDNLVATLSDTRRRGYAIAMGESERGVCAVSLPLRAATGATVAAVSLAVPSTRFTKAHILRFLPPLRETIEDIRGDVLESGVPARVRERRRTIVPATRSG